MMTNINQNAILEECSLAKVWENQIFRSINMIKHNRAKNLKCHFIIK